MVPDYVFYLDIEPKDAYRRIKDNGISFWEAGLDVKNTNSTEKKFLEFQNNVRKEFLRHSKEWGFTVLDANENFQI